MQLAGPSSGGGPRTQTIILPRRALAQQQQQQLPQSPPHGHNGWTTGAYVPQSPPSIYSLSPAHTAAAGFGAWSALPSLPALPPLQAFQHPPVYAPPHVHAQHAQQLHQQHQHQMMLHQQQLQQQQQQQQQQSRGYGAGPYPLHPAGPQLVFPIHSPRTIHLSHLAAHGGQVPAALVSPGFSLAALSAQPTLVASPPTSRRPGHVTIPVAGGFYESATISSTLRARSGAGTAGVIDDTEAPSARSIDIRSAEAHAISDASEIMLRPQLTKLGAYREKHSRQLSLQQRRRPSSVAGGDAPSTPGSGTVSRADSRAEMIAPPHHRPSTSISSPHRVYYTTPTAIDLSPQQASSGPPTANFSPTPPRHTIHVHKRSISYFTPPPAPPQPQHHHQQNLSSLSQPFNNVTPGPGPRSPLALLRASLLPSPSSGGGPPPVNFHLISRHKSRRVEPPKPDEEAKSPTEDEAPPTASTAADDDSLMSDDNRSQRSQSRGSEWMASSPSMSHRSSLYSNDRSHPVSHPISHAVSSSQSEATSHISSPAHSRQPSHPRAPAPPPTADGDHKPTISYLQPLVTASAFLQSHNLPTPPSQILTTSPATPTAHRDSHAPARRRTNSSADVMAMLSSGTGGGRPGAPAVKSPTLHALLASDLPMVPESGIALDASFSASMIRTQQRQADGDDQPSAPSTPKRRSEAPPSVQEGSLSMDALTVETPAPQPTGPKKFTMADFWAMHDHASEHPDPDSSDSSSEDGDQFDSNPMHLHARKLKPSGRHAQTLLHDSSSSSSDDEAACLAIRAKAGHVVKPSLDFGAFLSGAPMPKKKRSKKTKKGAKKDPPPSAAEMLSQSLNQLARAQIQQEHSLAGQKSKILGWFQRAVAGVASKRELEAAQAKAKQEETDELAVRIKRTEASIRVLKEARKSRRMEEQKAKDQTEARAKVFAMLGGGSVRDEAAEAKSPVSDQMVLQPQLTTLFTSSSMVMSYIEIEQLIAAGRDGGALTVFQHLVKMEAAGGITFDTPSQLVAAVKVLSLPIETTNFDMVQLEVARAHLPANAERFVLKHSEVELEMHRVLKLSKARKRNSKRRSRAQKQRAVRATNVTEVDQGDDMTMLVVHEDSAAELVNSTPKATPLPVPSPALISQMKAQQSIYEDQQAREELLERLTIQDNNVLFDGEQMMTTQQVEQLIEVGKGSKPTLRHIVQMEVEKVKFEDPAQLISAVTVLTIPAQLDYDEKLVNMTLIQAAVSMHKLPDSAGQYVLKHSEVDIEMHKVAIDLKRHSGNQMAFLLEHSAQIMKGGGTKALSASGNRRFKETPKTAQMVDNVVRLADLDEGTQLTVELVDTTTEDRMAQFAQLTPEEQEKEQMRIEEELARREVHKRLLPGSSLDPSSALTKGDASRRTSHLFVEGSVPMTPMQVDKLIEVGKGSKPTLRHIVQMEVEKVKFEDPIQLITAVKVLSVPIQSSNFNLERIEREITQGRVKLPSSAVEYVMKHSEVQLEMLQIERIGLAMSGNAANLAAVMESASAAERTAQIITYEEAESLLEEEWGGETESPEQLEQLRDEVARAEVHLRLENARSRLFRTHDVVMSSVQVDELIEEGNGGQPTLRHIVEMEVEDIQFDSPQQLITAVKVMNLPTKRNSGPLLDEAKSPRSNTASPTSPATAPPVTQKDVAAAAAEAKLPQKIVEYVLKHSEVQLEMAKVVPLRSAHVEPMHRIAAMEFVMDAGDDLFADHDEGSVTHMRAKMRAVEREMKFLQAGEDDNAMLEEEWVMETVDQDHSPGGLLTVPSLASAQSRRQSLVTFPMTAEVVEELIEESQAGDYVVKHLEKLSRDVDKKPFHTKEELVAAVAEEHAAYMEVEEHARIEVHHRLEHDRPTSVFKLGTKMVPAQVDHLIDQGHGAVPTLKHIVRMEHSNVKFKEPAELVSAVQVLSLPLETVTLESISHSVLAAHLPADATKFVMKYMAQELKMFDVDVEENEVEVEEAPAPVRPQLAPVAVQQHSLDAPIAQPLTMTLSSEPNRRSLIAIPRVLSPTLDDGLVEEEVGRRSASSSRLGDRPEGVLNVARRAARNSGQLPLGALLTSPSYLSPSAPTPVSTRTPQGRHSLNAPPLGSQAMGGTNASSLDGSLPSSLNSTMVINRKSLHKIMSANISSSPTNLSFAPSGTTSPSPFAPSPPTHRVHEAELTMEEDDPALVSSRSGSRMDDSRRQSSHVTVQPNGAGMPLTITLRPAFSQQSSPAMSMHTTFNHAQVAAFQEAHSHEDKFQGNLNYDALRVSPVPPDSANDSKSLAPTPARSPPLIDTSVSSDGSPAHLSTEVPLHARSVSPHGLAGPGPTHGARVLNIHPSFSGLGAPSSLSPADSPTSDAGPKHIGRFSLTTPFNVSKDIHPGHITPIDTPQRSASPLESRSPSSLSGHVTETPSIRHVISPQFHALSVPLPHSGHNSLTNTVSHAGALAQGDSRSTSPVSHSPSHSPLMAPFTVTVTEASRHVSRLPSRVPTPLMQQLQEQAALHQQQQPDVIHVAEEQATSFTQVESATPLIKVDSPTKQPSPPKHESPPKQPPTSPNFETTTLAMSQTQLDGFALASTSEQQRRSPVKGPPLPLPITVPAVVPTPPVHEAADVDIEDNESATPAMSQVESPLLGSNKVISPVLRPQALADSPKQAGRQLASGSPKQSGSPVRTSPHSSPPMSRTATFTLGSQMPGSPLRSLKNRSAIAAAANEKAAQAKKSPKTTPKSSPSQSLQPTPMQSLTVSPIASPRSSGGALAYSNMAAAVITSRSRSTQPGTPTSGPVVIQRTPLSEGQPASPHRRTSSVLPTQSMLGGSPSASTLNVPNKPETMTRRTNSSLGSISGTPLKDVLEQEASNIDTTMPVIAISLARDHRDSGTPVTSNRSSNSRETSVNSSPSPADDARAEIERRKRDIMSLHGHGEPPSLTPTPSTGSLLVPAGGSGSAPNSKRGSRRNNTVAEWTPDNEDEMKSLTGSAAGRKKPLATKQHRKAGSVFTASYLQPTLSSSGTAAMRERERDASSTPLATSSGGSFSSSSGYTPSFLQPTQSHALKAVRAAKNAAQALATQRGINSAKASPRPRRKESKLFTEAAIEEGLDETRGGSASSGLLSLHNRTASTEEMVELDDDEPPLDRTPSVEQGEAARAGLEKEQAQTAAATLKASEVLAQREREAMQRKPWQPSQLFAGAGGGTDSFKATRTVVRAPTLTDEELAHQNEIERVRSENESRRKLKEQAALLEAQRLTALANDPAEQLRLRREKRKNEFRARKEAELSAEQRRRLAEEARVRAEAERAAVAAELAEKLEAERVSAEGRADTERRIAARAAKELEHRQRIIADFERKKAEALEVQRVAEEAERIASMPKYLAVGTVAAVARMGENQKLGNGQTAAEYLDAMRSRSVALREKAAANKKQLEQVKLHALHERDDALVAHIAEIRRNKAELYESEQLELQYAQAEKEAKAQEALRVLKEQSELDTAQKHRELAERILQAQLRLHTTDADKSRELDAIYREHEEEARRKAEEVNSKLELIKFEKARENDLMLARARALKLEYESHAEDELRSLVEVREGMREKAAATVAASAYTPKVGIEYFAENDLLHLAGLPANHPLMLQQGISRLDEQGNAVWATQQPGAAGGGNSITNVGSSAPASFAQPTPSEDRAGLDSVRGASSLHPPNSTPVRSSRSPSTASANDYAAALAQEEASRQK